MSITRIKEPFSNPDWIYEIKWDGFRAIAEINEGNVKLYSRKFYSYNKKFEPITRELEKIKYNMILDGEVVVTEESGKSNFYMLQNYWRTGYGQLTYYVFDILSLDGKNLEKLPLIERKTILKKNLPESIIIKYVDHIEEKGEKLFELVQKNNLEGMIAKRKKSLYLPGRRSKDWLKIKNEQKMECFIAGYTFNGKRNLFNSLILGIKEGDDLIFIGDGIRL